MSEKLPNKIQFEAPTIAPVDLAYSEVVEKVSTIVHKISGNKFGKQQESMIESRIKKRMIELDMPSPKAYLEYIDKNQKTEINALVSILTTHHTFFFREFAHFELVAKMLPELIASCKKRGEKTISIWSAACSRGHEVYSLAMFMEYYLPQHDPSMSYKILGTDIDSASVQIASNGVYHHNELKEIPMNFLGDHWAKGSGEIFLYSKIKKTVKAKCEFREGNLLSVKDIVKNEKFDIIFCRNVFIYFEAHQIDSISKDLLKALHPTGILFTGLSESLSASSLEIVNLAPSAYAHKAGAAVATSNTNTNIKINSNSKALEEADAAAQIAYIKSLEAKVAKVPTCYRVLCVDDSPSILSFLKKILTKESGFEVVDTASNGIEAAEKLKTLKVDLVTLDIHMPNLDGVGYLKKYYNSNHPPVVMIASASRDDADVAVQALIHGASDYVEKPTVTNLDDRSDEIRIKLRAAASIPHTKYKMSSMDKGFQTKITIEDPETKMRILMATLTDMPKIISFFAECTQIQPPSFVFLEGYGDAFEAVIKKYQHSFKQKVMIYDENTKNIEVNTIYFADAKKMMKTLQREHGRRVTSILCYGMTSRWAAHELRYWSRSNILMEDFGENENRSNPMHGRASDFMPATSFAYMSNCALSDNNKKKAG